MNRKIRVVVILGLALALWAGVACAADGPTDPGRRQMEAFKREEQAFIRRLNVPAPDEEGKEIHYSASGAINRIEIIGDLKPESTLGFAAYVNSPYDPYALEYRWGITDVNRDSGGYLYYPQHGDLTGKGGIDYRFFSAGTYSVFVSA